MQLLTLTGLLITTDLNQQTWQSLEVYSQNNNSYFDFRITRWSGTDTYGNACKSDADIDKALDSTTFQIAMLNNYFDFEDYNKPIKSYLDDTLNYYLMSGFTKRVDLYVRQNSVELVDSIFRYQPGGSEDSFISIEPVFLTN